MDVFSVSPFPVGTSIFLAQNAADFAQNGAGSGPNGANLEPKPSHLDIAFSLALQSQDNSAFGFQKCLKGADWEPRRVQNSEKVRVLTPKGSDPGANLEPNPSHLDVGFFAFSAKSR